MTDSLLFSALSIFLLRIADVSIGTLRIGMLVRGQRALAGVLSFCESMVWLIAAAQVLGSLDAPIQFVAYAGGYAAGTMLGATIERWLAIGSVMVRIASPVTSPSPADALREAGYRVTVINASGRDGEVRVSFSVIPRRKTAEVLRIIEEVNPNAFVTFEGTTATRVETLPAARHRK